MPLLEKAIFGDVNKRRISFVKERLVDITWGRRPDCDKYLDENGNKRPVPRPSMPSPLNAYNYGEGESSIAQQWRVTSCDDDEVGRPTSPSDVGMQEKARKEWLQYYLEVGDWAKASELVVTKAERDDLDYLKRLATHPEMSTALVHEDESPIL